MPVPRLDLPLLQRPWGAALTAALVVVNLVASLHAILRKRDVRAATGWTGLIWLVPWVGAVLYAALGLNRIKRRASLMHRARRRAPLTTTGQLRIAREIGRAHV